MALGLDGEVLEAVEDTAMMCPECAQQFEDLAAYTAHYESVHQG